MVRVHGAGAQRLSARTRGVPLEELVAVAVDVGGSTAAAMVCDVTGQVLVAPFEFAMNRVGVAELTGQVDRCFPGWARCCPACAISRSATADARITAILPATRYQVLTTVPGWGPLRAGGYAAAVGDPDRWPAARQIYRAAGLTPSHYESAGKRRDGGISREGSVELRRALLDLGVGLWHSEPAARCYATRLRQRGTPGGIIATAMARIAGRLAYAMVRDQTAYDPTQRRS